MLKRNLRNNATTQALKLAWWKRKSKHVKGFLFLATTGRSGTLSFDQILHAWPGCVALHEPEPIMNGEVLRRHNQGDDALMQQEWREWKMPAIYKVIQDASWYVESNHLFIKTFCGLAVEEFGDKLQVLHVTRAPREVAASFLKRGSVPGTKWGDTWLGSYSAPKNEIQVAQVLDDNPHFAHPFFKVLWYWFEIEARTARFRLDYPSIKVVDFGTEDFNDAGKLHALCCELFGEFDRKLIDRMAGTRAHASPESPSVPDGLSDSQIAEFEQKCQAQLAPLLAQVQGRAR